MRKLGICFLIVMFLVVTGCSSNESKTVTNLDNFASVTSSSDFSVIDTSSEYSEASYVVGVREAKLDGIKIEMFEYTDTESAELVHEEHIENFNLLKATGAFEVDEPGKNYHKYELVSNGYFMISTQVENTVIFCKTLLENKETVEEIFTELGY